MIRVDLPRFGAFDAFRAATRLLASHRIPAERVRWARPDDPPDLFAAEPLPGPGAAPVTVSTALLDLARSVGCHRAPEALPDLYAAILRAQEDRGFLANPADAQTRRLERLAKSVGRDIHKMHAFVRFHELPADGSRRRFAAWFEPDHLILEAAAPFFARRFADMDWLIATPEGVARFDGRLSLDDPAPRPDLPADAGHALWSVYFAHIFNPARLKPEAMRSHMPLKYWRNLPETRLIATMLAEAPARVQRMREATATQAPGRAARIGARLHPPRADRPPETLAEAGIQARHCTRCALCEAATQTVWGEGDPAAALMIVGEAPGDHEDLQGRPFVGPAGRLLRELMTEAGVKPERAWLTNAVKHFKYRPRGKLRLHQNPHRGEIEHCRWWLGLERRLLQPRLTLALGATAALALTGRAAPLSPRRGTIEPAQDGGPVLLTWHPSAILRAGAEAPRMRAELVADLRSAEALIAGASPAPPPHP